MRPLRRAKLFRNGGSQAVRLPREFRLAGNEVLVHREGSRIVLEPIEEGWSAEFIRAFTGTSPASFPERQQPRSQGSRESLDE